MRNELNDIEKIERYLKNEMNSEERNSFESEMQQNPDLRKKMEEQKELLKGMERMKMKNDISKAKFKYRLQKGMLNIGIPVLITAAVTALILNWSSTKEAKPETPNSKPETNYELPTLNESGDSLWADADKYIPYQLYNINTDQDTVLVGKEGLVVAVPASCFVDENGNAVKGEITFELKEALQTETILKGGLSTMSNGDLLETGGMFYINARKDGKSLKIAEGKNIYADVPGDKTKTGMLLFDGERKPDGSINWINPKPIEKPLVPVDIKTLNFYPPLYEDSLANMNKDVTNKKYKDSLYYSFAGRFGKIVIDTSSTKIPIEKVVVDVPFDGGRYSKPAKINNGEQLFNKICASCHKPVFNYTGPALKGARKRWKTAYEGNTAKIYEWVANPAKVLAEGNPYVVSVYQKFKSGGLMAGHNLSKKEIDAIFDYVDNYVTSDNDTMQTFSGLNPAKVKSIWNDKFQNTLIATKEFEERMPFIHRLCDKGNNVLDMYVKNIDKRICTIDSMVAHTLSGSDKEQFLQFAARGEGRVKTEDNCLKNLGEFYDKQTKIYTEVANKTSEEYYKKNLEKDSESNRKSAEQNSMDSKRKSENFTKELDINLDEAYHQLGKKRPRIPQGGGGNATGVAVQSTGWKNVDRYVLAATTNRETMVYTDPQTKKKAVLKYESLNVKVNESENYDRVLVYLLPDQLNSFMRMNKSGNIFTEKLNMLFKHELVILAYKDNEAFYKHIKDVQPGELNDISLEKMSEGEISVNLNSMNKMQQSEEVKNDIAYQFFLQADQKRKKTFLANEKFIRRIEKVIFPCGNTDTWKTVDMNETEIVDPEGK